MTLFSAKVSARVSGTVFACALLAGCANMIDKPYQKIHVVTPGAVEAECFLKTPRNAYRVITPGYILAERSENTLEVTCEKGNYYPATARVESKLNLKRQPLNILNGLLPGVAYDVASHSVHAYPDEISVAMEQDPYAMLANTPTEEPSPRALERKESHVDIPVVETLPAERTFNQSLRK